MTNSKTQVLPFLVCTSMLPTLCRAFRTLRSKLFSRNSSVTLKPLRLLLASRPIGWIR